MYRINEGTVSESDGSYTLARTGEDTLQGYASNFADLELLEVGDYVQLSFVIKPRDSGNVTNRAVSWGFFQGSLVSDHAQTGITDLWQGYFHQIATRNSDGTSGMGVFRQGEGPVGLMDYAGGGTEVNGASATQNVVPIHPTNFAEVTLRLEKISETQIRLSSHYETPGGTNRSGNGGDSGITWNYSVAAPASGSGANVATLNAIYPLADGPVSFNGFAIASIGDNWVLRDLSIESNVITEPPPVQPATVTFSDLIQTVDGEPRSPTVTTNPPALAYSITFDGSPAAPATSGIYQVLATVTEEGYEGSATDFFRLLTPEGIVDSSGSGADDEWEMETFGNLENDPVLINGQAFTRRQVYFWGLPNPTEEAFAMNGLNFPTVPNRWYQIQFLENLTEEDWVDLDDPFQGNGQARQVEDAQPGFYRVRVMLAP